MMHRTVRNVGMGSAVESARLGTSSVLRIARLVHARAVVRLYMRSLIARRHVYRTVAEPCVGTQHATHKYALYAARRRAHTYA